MRGLVGHAQQANINLIKTKVGVIHAPLKPQILQRDQTMSTIATEVRPLRLHALRANVYSLAPVKTVQQELTNHLRTLRAFIVLVVHLEKLPAQAQQVRVIVT